MLFMPVRPLPSFNPRARRGRDAMTDEQKRLIAVSIHAPAGGATGILWDDDCQIVVSIHAPAGGATCMLWQRRYLF